MTSKPLSPEDAQRLAQEATDALNEFATQLAKILTPVVKAAAHAVREFCKSLPKEYVDRMERKEQHRKRYERMMGRRQ